MRMEISEKEKEQYFRLISHRFLSLRGTPFFLSSKELDQIENWLQTGIPLRVVLEGIQFAYEDFRKKPVRRGRKLYLVFCNAMVLKSFKQYKDRKVGLKQKVDNEDDKKEAVKIEAEAFLEKMHADVAYLKAAYLEAVQELSREKFNEDKLEHYEEKIEALLLMNAPQEEKDKAEEYARRELKILDTGELDKVINLKIIKSMRDKYKIPYVSPYYY